MSHQEQTIDHMRAFLDAIRGDAPGFLFQPQNYPKQIQFSSNQSAASKAIAARETADVYFSVGAFLEGQPKRKAQFVQSFRSLFIDIDAGAGKPYSDAEAARQALDKFVEETGCVYPSAIVNTGGGIHAYWCFTENIEKADWLRCAQALKKFCPLNGLQIDSGVTADAARVMRMPGTLNRKKGPHRECHLVWPEGDGEFLRYDFQPLETFFTQRVGPPRKRETVCLSSRADWDNPEVAQINSALQCISPDLEEPDWFRILGALKRASSSWPPGAAQHLAHEWSRQGNKYNEAAFDDRWDRLRPEDGLGLDLIREMAASAGWIRSAGADGVSCPEHLLRIDRSDAGNVAILATLTRGDLRHVGANKLWIAWDGYRWNRDADGTRVHRAALLVAEKHLEEARQIEKRADDGSLTSSDRKNLEKVAESKKKWAARCRDKSTLDAMIALAQRDERFVVDVSALDSNPKLLGVQNGVVDLTTGLLKADSREDFITKRCAVDYVPDAPRPRWLEFIKEITATPESVVDDVHEFRERPKLARYLQKMLGYCMTGLTSEHKLFLLMGSGSNGKNILLDTVTEIIADYAESVGPEMFMAKRFDNGAEQATPATRKLAGARMVTCSETKEGQKFDLAVVKRHTGGGFQTARGLHESPFTFLMTHKPILMTNSAPVIDHMDSATKGRLHVIPFAMQWNRPGETNPNPRLPNAQKNLMEVLRGERTGILAWLVKGTRLYLEEELDPPREVAGFTAEYVESQDGVARWMADACEVCDVEGGLLAKELLLNYRQWCLGDDAPVIIETAEALGRKLKAKSCASKRYSNGTRYGLRPKPT